MKKIFLALIATTAVAAITLTSCKEEKEQIAGTVYYETDAGEAVNVIYGHGAYANQFVAEMNKVMSKYQGAVNPNDKQIATDFRAVANQFNNRYLLGTFKLTKKFGDEITTLETYSLQTQPKFYVYNYTNVQGSESLVSELQQAVTEAVAILDEADEKGSLTENMVKEAMQEVYDTYKSKQLAGDLVISYYDGSKENNVATYTFVPQPIYRVRNFDSDHVVCVKGYNLTNPFRSPLRNATNDDEALEIADSVQRAINKTYFDIVKDSMIILSKSVDMGTTFTEIKRYYTVERAGYVIGMDSLNLRSVEYPRVANTVFTKMQESLMDFAKEGLVYDRANIDAIAARMRQIAKNYKQDGFYPDLEGTVTLFGLKKDNTQEVLVTIDMNNL